MLKVNQKGIAHLLLPIILILGLIAAVYLITSGNPLKLFSKAGGGPIWFTDLKGNPISQTTSPTIKIQFISTLGLPAGGTSGPLNIQGGGPSAPINRTTKSFRFAENPTDLSSMPYLAYISEPMIVEYTFKDTTLGKKFIWVEFLGSDGSTDRRSAQIELVKESVSGPISSPTPAPMPGVPEMVYPQNGQTLDLEGAYMFKVKPVAGSTGYLFGLFQNGVMVYENYRDTKQLSPNGEFALQANNPAHNKFQAGQVKVMIRALVNNQWTDAREITIILKPRATKPVAAMRVFLTSTTYNGNLGGLSGADAKCQTRADAAKLGGTWKAWLSDTSTSAASRLEHYNGPYKRLDGAIVANNWNDLVDGSIQNGIYVIEFGTNFSTDVWTNTKIDGSTKYGGNAICENWTTNDDRGSLNFSTTGVSYLKNSTWTDGNNYMPCSISVHLYCFEQSSTGGSATITAQPLPIEKLTLRGLISAFGSKRGDSRYNPSYDADQNGYIDIRDFSLLRAKKLL